MNILDIAVLVILVLSGLLAFSRGFGKEVLSLAGWILSALLTFHFLYPAALPLAQKYITVPLLAEFIAATVPFLLSLLLMALLSAWIRAFFKAQFAEAGLGSLNRSLGFAFGLLRGFILLSILYLLLLWAVPRAEDRPAMINEARSLPWIARGADMLQSLLPARFADIGKSALDDAGQAAGKAKQGYDAYQILNAPTAAPVTAPIQAAPQAPPTPPLAPGIGNNALPAKPDAAPAGQNGYKDSERKDLERLIEGTGQGQ